MQLPTPEKTEPPMDADGRGLILKMETEAIIGCAFEVLNELVHGLLEKPYENALRALIKLIHDGKPLQEKYRGLVKQPPLSISRLSIFSSQSRASSSDVRSK
jgi:hypothetical protein